MQNNLAEFRNLNNKINNLKRQLDEEERARWNNFVQIQTEKKTKEDS